MYPFLICVSVHNEREKVPGLIEAIEALEPPPGGLALVSDGPCDGTADAPQA